MCTYVSARGCLTRLAALASLGVLGLLEQCQRFDCARMCLPVAASLGSLLASLGVLILVSNCAEAYNEMSRTSKKLRKLIGF